MRNEYAERRPYLRLVPLYKVRGERAVTGAFFQRIDGSCREALCREIMAWPKPGLVTPVDSGSHRDMDIHTFLASIASLKGTFAAMARAGAENADFGELQTLGIDAEARMLEATSGINTHRGAIFNLGLLSAAAGLRWATPALADAELGSIVAQRWGTAILAARGASTHAPHSHGDAVYASHGVGGARAEAAAGFPTVYGAALPVLRHLLAQALAPERAMIGVLLVLMARLEDSNLVWRGGADGLRFVRQAAQAFNDAGGVLRPEWRKVLLALHDRLVRWRLSPGGSADLTAATWLVHNLERGSQR